MGRGRLTLLLYNTYDPSKLHEAHLRAVSRIGPVAVAWDCNVGLIGFPPPTPKKALDPNTLVEIIEKKSTIAKEKRFLRELLDAGRLSLHNYPRKGFPPQLGTIVATTSNPEPSRSITPETIARRMGEGESFGLLIGLGRRGLPKEVRKMAKHELDITQRGVPLETCTALGAIPPTIATTMRYVTNAHKEK